MRSVSEKGGDANQALGGELNVVELLKTYDISALENWYASICRKVSQYLAAIRDRRPECVSERIMTMFQKNPSGSYSLHELARMFYMSPAYLGSTFKKKRTDIACMAHGGTHGNFQKSADPNGSACV